MPVPTGGKGYNSCTTKVVKAEKRVVSGKVEFTALEVAYIDLNPATATILHVETCVQQKWGEDFVVVSNDGLRICDSSATRG